MIAEQRIEDFTDQFPIGMKVLAVDDDPTCLLLLERLLRKCKYHVTTRTHAFAALSLLRENKNLFDLVISDVHMPDMDGFKLLELVGLEMDLPFIMLSAYGDTKLVMKGVAHGACNYLLKPVRIEELQIIWQHVIRKKKVDSNDQRSYGAGNETAEHNFNKKRKDLVEDDKDDHDENGTEIDDASAQKKPRVVWSIELHRKFVAAVNHLGVGSQDAVPKRILELMNVENLTRENVASHLQKYKIHLRRISCEQSAQENMVAAFGSTDQISSLNGTQVFNSLSGSPQFQNAAFRPFQNNMMIGSLNSSVCPGIQQLPSPVQINHSQFSVFPGHAANQGSSLLLGNPNEFAQLKDNNDRGVSQIEEARTKANDLTSLPAYTFLPYAKTAAGSMNSARLTAMNNTLMLIGHPVQAHSRIGGIGNQDSATFASLSPDSSHVLDQSWGSDRWSVGVQSSAVKLNSNASCRGTHPVNTHLDDGSFIRGHPLPVIENQFQESQSSIGIRHDRAQILDSFATASKLSPVNPSNIGHAMSSPYEQVTNSRMPNARGISELNRFQQPAYVDTIPMQRREVDNSTTSISNMKKPQAYQLSENTGSLEDLVSSIMKPPDSNSGT